MVSCAGAESAGPRPCRPVRAQRVPSCAGAELRPAPHLSTVRSVHHPLEGASPTVSRTGQLLAALRCPGARLPPCCAPLCNQLGHKTRARGPTPPRPLQIVSLFSMWIMWACVWLHQWHPIILPTRANLHDLEALHAGMGGGGGGGH